DTDGDGFNDRFELNTSRTSPVKPDSDFDGLTDREEVIIFGTDPRNVDSDDGGVSDGVEVDTGTDPLDGSDDRVKR
ncbi:MAG: hypothetical protein AB8B87_25335, partial [Granulosicoccus sp.]